MKKTCIWLLNAYTTKRIIEQVVKSIYITFFFYCTLDIVHKKKFHYNRCCWSNNLLKLFLFCCMIYSYKFLLQLIVNYWNKLSYRSWFHIYYQTTTYFFKSKLVPDDLKFIFYTHFGNLSFCFDDIFRKPESSSFNSYATYLFNKFYCCIFIFFLVIYYSLYTVELLSSINSTSFLSNSSLVRFVCHFIVNCYIASFNIIISLQCLGR